MRIPGLEPGKKPTLPPPGRNYHIEFYDPLRSPVRKYLSLKTRDPRLALSRANRIIELCRAGEFDAWESEGRVLPSLQPVTVAAAVEEYLEWLRREPCGTGLPLRPSTFVHYESLFVRFLRWIEEKAYSGALLTDVKPEHVRGFAFHRGLRPGTIATQLNRVKAFLAWAVKRRYLRQNPADELKAPRGRGRISYFTRAQYALFIRHICEHIEREGRGRGRYDSEVPTLLRAVILAVHTGMRRSEICHLRWQDVDLCEDVDLTEDEGDGLSVIRVVDSERHRTKNGRSRTIALVGAALEMMRALRASVPPETEYVFPGQGGGPFRAPYLSVKFKELIKAAGLPDGLSFHSTRHTFATWLAQVGAGEFIIQSMLGHSSNDVTQIYMHMGGNGGRAALLRVFGKKP